MIEPTGDSFEQESKREDTRASDATAPGIDADGDHEDQSPGGIMGRLFGTRSETPPADRAGPDSALSGSRATPDTTMPNTTMPDTTTRDATTPHSPSPRDARTPLEPDAVSSRIVEPDIATPRAGDSTVSIELGERVQTGFSDLSRLLGAIKETLSSRDGPVQQTLQALPDFLVQVPRIHRAEIECLAQISKQLEHMGSGTRDVVSRLEGLPDLLRSLMLSQTEQARYLDNLQSNFSEALETQGKALTQGLETARKSSETQLQMVRSIAKTQEGTFATFQNTQNRALNVFHRAQQQAIQQNKDSQKTTNRQIEMLVDRVHVAQGRVFWLSIGFAALAAAGLIAVLFFA